MKLLFSFTKLIINLTYEQYLETVNKLQTNIGVR